MRPAKCYCHLGFEDSCRIHNKEHKAANQWAVDYFDTNKDTLGLEPFHEEMLEVAFLAGYKALAAKLKLATEAIEFYANTENWIKENMQTGMYGAIIDTDCADYLHITRDVRLTGGRLARQTLKQLKDEK